jgi:hypothetical protein
MIVDLLLTLHGQPKSYWQNPATALEPNPLVRHLMVKGIGAFLLAVAIYCAIAFLLVSILPRWIGFVTALVYSLGHFYAGSTWLEARMGMGMNGVYLYAVPLAVAIAICTGAHDGSSNQAMQRTADRPHA